MRDSPSAGRLFWDFRSANRRRRRFLGLAIFAVGLLIAAALFDAPVTRALTGWPDHEKAGFEWLTQFGEAAWPIIPAILAISIGYAGRLASPAYTARWALRATSAIGWFVLLGTGLPSLAATILKRIIGRARPLHLEQMGTLSFQPWQPQWDLVSFPSGHATTGFSVAVVLTALLGRRFVPLFAGFAILMALSRIVLGMHFLTDVAAGAVLGTLGAIAVRDQFLNRGWIFRSTPAGLRNRMAAPLRRVLRSPRGSARAQRRGPA